MKRINDVMHITNELFFKGCLENKEYEYFKHIRITLIDEFYGDDIDGSVKLLNALDDLHIIFLNNEPPLISDQVVNFRDIAFELIKQKGVTE